MTRDGDPDGDVTNSQEFEAALAAAVESAVGAGVDVRGAWEFQTRGSIHDWEVQIVELDRESDGE